MADLIDREALLAESRKTFRPLHELLKEAPRVDAVEVVHCKDCECWDEENKGGRATLGTLVCACDNWSNQEDGYVRYTRPDDFCSYGERKEVCQL